jgi:hypothetical protein
MQNNTRMSGLLITRKRSTLSLPVFPARTYHRLIKQAEKESKDTEAVYGQRYAGLQTRLSLVIWFLKTLRSCSIKDLNMSYETYPRSGTMRNGTVSELRTSGTRITACGCTLLPTPMASDYDVGYCDRQALLNYLGSGHQRRLIYDFRLAGLTDSEILELYREVMSFTISDAKYTPSGTQSCLW